MSLQIRAQSFRNSGELGGKKPYIAQVLADGGLRFAPIEAQTGEEEFFRLIAFPGDILDCRISVKDKISGEIRTGQFLAALVSPQVDSSCPAERLGLVRFGSIFWEEFEPFFSTEWRITKTFLNDGMHLSWPVELPGSLRQTVNHSGRYFLAENRCSHRLFHDAESVAGTDWVTDHVELVESQPELTLYTKRLIAELKTAHINNS